MSVKRSSGSSTRSSGGSDGGAKVGRQELYDELKRLSGNNASFTPVDVSLTIGAGEPQVSRALLGLAAEGCVEKVEPGRYRVAPMFGDLTMSEFLKVFNRASKTDSTRQRDLSEIGRLKQNNDIMRGKLLAAIAERDHYLAALKRHNIDPGPAPVPSVPAPEPAPEAPAAQASQAQVDESPDDPPTGLA